MHKRLPYIFFVLMMAASFAVRAQFFIPCIDSLSAMPFYPCPDPRYFPVCGCDGKTYRNECEARLRNGVMSYTEGSCVGFDFDIFPTFVSAARNYRLDLTMVQQQPLNFARLFVVDAFGQLWLQRELPPTERFEMSIDFLPMRFGVYIVYIFDTRGNYRVTKIVRAQ